MNFRKWLKAKPKRAKKKVDQISTTTEYDKERLNGKKDRVEKMKQKLVK
jgi:hypothetical protein